MTEADILATTYDDTCTVYRPFKKVLESGETAFQDGLQGQVVYRDLACSLARPTGGSPKREKPVIKAGVEYVLFVRPEIDIQQSDTIVVTQQGREIIVMAGRPAYYPSHNEVPATLTKERA